MAVPQITIRLAPNSKAKFDEYAGSCGLDASELARLLIARERIQKRLAKLASKGARPTKPRRQRGLGRMPTITAHLPIGQVREFDRYARGCGLNRNEAGAWLLETELRERWLEKCIATA